MKWSQVRRNWTHVKPMIRQHWSRLTFADMKAIRGRRDRLEERLQLRYGFGVYEARRRENLY